MKELVNQNEKAGGQSLNWRLFNIVLSGMMTLLTFPSWASLFFAVCCWVAWTDRPKQEENGTG